MDYARAESYLQGKQDRPYGTGRATRVHRRPDGGIGIKYHATDVVSYYPDGRIVLNSDGYQTVTTKARINDLAPCRVWSDRGAWTLSYSGQTVPYADGITLHPNGTVTGEGTDTQARAKILQREVRDYITGFCKSVAEARTLAEPGGGDCWGCLMRPVSETPNGQNAYRSATWTEPMGYDHYREHFKGGYYVPALVRNAILSAGYQNPGVIWNWILTEAQRGETGMLARVLRSHFRKIRTHLL